jgi:hypothetical protein
MSAAVLVDSSIVAPVDPFQGRDLDLVQGAPWPAQFGQFGLVSPVDRLCEGVVAGAGHPDRRADAGIVKPFGERHRYVLGCLYRCG